MKRSAAVALVLAVACSAAKAPVDSGVEGTVLLGPTCPVVREGMPCPDRPYQATIRVVALPSGTVIATVRADAQGRFRVALEPGGYRLEPVLAKSPPSGGPVDVTVRAHEFATVTIRLDSGIR